jgi:hypothetical protein
VSTASDPFGEDGLAGIRFAEDGDSDGFVVGGSGSLKRPRRRRHRLRRVALVSVLVIVLVGLVFRFVPIPMLDAYLSDKVTQEIAARMACPGSSGPAVQVRLGGGPVLPQLLRGRLSQVHVVVPDTAIGGAAHARVEVTLEGVTEFRSDTPRAERLESSTTIAFADMPPPEVGPAPVYSRGPDGSLAMTQPMTPEQTKHVTSVQYMSLSLRGNPVVATPERLKLFDQMLDAGKLPEEVTGGAVVTPLPKLPAGLAYTGVGVQQDGVHVRLDGVVVRPLSTLPTEADGKQVSYSVRDGELGITSTAIDLAPIYKAEVTIWTVPRLQGNALTMVPQSVEVLGADRSTTSMLGSLVLSQVDPASLTTQLPVLPSGVRYKSVSVDSGGVKVAVGGETVQPLSTLPPPEHGLPYRYGAADGYLTVTTTGMPANDHSMITSYAFPRIVGTNTLDSTPQRILIFDHPFPARNVFAVIGDQHTTYSLEQLPDGLRYSGVQVPPEGFRLLVSGENVALTQGLPGQTCPAPDSL